MENKIRPEKYVVLEHLTLPDRGLRFWSHNTENNTHGYNGELWYKEVLFTDSEDEAIAVSRISNNLPTYNELSEYWRIEIAKQNANIDEDIPVNDISQEWKEYYKNQYIK